MLVLDAMLRISLVARVVRRRANKEHRSFEGIRHPLSMSLCTSGSAKRLGSASGAAMTSIEEAVQYQIEEGVRLREMGSDTAFKQT